MAEIFNISFKDKCTYRQKTLTLNCLSFHFHSYSAISCTTYHMPLCDYLSKKRNKNWWYFWNMHSTCFCYEQESNVQYKRQKYSTVSASAFSYVTVNFPAPTVSASTRCNKVVGLPAILKCEVGERLLSSERNHACISLEQQCTRNLFSNTVNVWIKALTVVIICQKYRYDLMISQKNSAKYLQVFLFSNYYDFKYWS